MKHWLSLSEWIKKAIILYLRSIDIQIWKTLFIRATHYIKFSKRLDKVELLLHNSKKIGKELFIAILHLHNKILISADFVTKKSTKFQDLNDFLSQNQLKSKIFYAKGVLRWKIMISIFLICASKFRLY